jgi:uncharacterized RDD family membrane protein YckC
MNQPPQPPDPNDLTQPIPVVSPPPAQQVPPVYQQAAPPGTPTSIARTPYVHRFGNVPFYLVTRFAAFFLDIFGIAFLVATFGFHAFESGYLAYGGRDEAGFLSLAGASLGIALALAYLSESLLGTTLGKAVFALHTRAVSGGHAGGGRVFIRYLLRPIDLLLIGPLLALATPRHRHLGDYAAGTVVSRSRFGPVAPIVGIVLLLAIGYAQIVYGGGLTSAIEVAAEVSNFAPDVIGKAAHAVGLGGLPLPAVNVPTPVAATPFVATAVPATPAATSPALASPAAEPSGEPGTEAPVATEAPSDEASDAPQTQPTDRVLNQ